MATKKSTKATKTKSAPRRKGRLAKRKSPIDAALVIVKKVLKDDDPTITIDPNDTKKTRDHLKTGSIRMDYLIGGQPNRFKVPPCPGWPSGAISQVWGHESSGKTTVALEAAVQVIEEGGSVVFIDWEHALDKSYARSLGIPVGNQSVFYYCQPNTLEAGMAVIIAMATAGVDLIILDSIGAALPKLEFEKAIDEQTKVTSIGLEARAWSKFLPKIQGVICKSGTHLMGISQTRANIGGYGYGASDSTQGGRAWKFYSQLRMEYRRISQEEENVWDAAENKYVKKKVTSIIKAKVVKSKVSSSQHHDATFYIRFGSGIDDARSVIDICTNYKKVIKSGNWLSYTMDNGELIRSNGAAAFRKEVVSRPALLDDMYDFALRKLYVDGIIKSTQGQPEQKEEAAADAVEAALLEVMSEITGDDKKKDT